ncbi:hypothetical protein ABHF33_07130 [Chitinibacter sp. FCG-7]|uniref:DUF5666 domain-containing protein n=1 Tax=Chitinibacter mangrovi TaxID=3153927 RepID=A0AAU7FDS8_9NEIS
MQKINLWIGAIAVMLAASSFADTGLPFVGTRYFNFMGGTGTEQAITIKADGATVIKSIGKFGESVIYKGKYKNPLNLKDGSGYEIKGEMITSLSHGKPEKGCDLMYEDAPCSTKMYMPKQ